jgi:hypothetical protein
MGSVRLTMAGALPSAIVACVAILACVAMPGTAKAGDGPSSNSSTQEQRSTPQPAPTGCPFRNGKLELIA